MAKPGQQLSSRKLSAIILCAVLFGVVVTCFIPFQDNPFYTARVERQTKQRLKENVTVQFTKVNEYLQGVDVSFAAPTDVTCPDGPFSGTSPCTSEQETNPKELPVNAEFVTRWLHGMPDIDAKLKQDGWKYFDSNATSANNIVPVQDIFSPNPSDLVSVGYTKQNAETHDDYCAIFIQYTNKQAKTLRINELCNN